MGQVCSGDKPEAKKSGAFQDTSNDVVFDGHGHPLGDATHTHDQQQNQRQDGIQDSGGSALGDAATEAEDRAKGERLKAEREEQARLDLIVSTAGRGMVSVRSTRGSTMYYDQGFAAALALHLEQTTQFPNELAIRLPPPPSSSSNLTAKSSSAIGPSDGDGEAGAAASTAGTSLSTAAGEGATGPSSGAMGNGGAEGGEGDANSTATSATSNGVYARLSQPLWQGIKLGTKGTGVAGCAGENPVTYMDQVAESLLEDIVPSKQKMFLGAQPIIENLL